MSDEIVFDVLCTKVLDALRALGLGKFSIRNYYYEGMWPIIKVYRSEGVILYSAAFTNEIVDRFQRFIPICRNCTLIAPERVEELAAVLAAHENKPEMRM